MVTRVDPLLAMLISSLRELPTSEKEDRILSERRKILSSSEAEPYIRYSNVLKSIYIGMLSYRINGVDFLNACESDILRIKTAGYLGMAMMESDEHVIMMINTIMKDLGRRETRNDALTAICNLRDDNMVLYELVRYICPNGRGDPFHKKTLVAFYRLNPEAKISIVGQDPSEIYVKIQIVLDSLLKSDEICFTENDVLFLGSLFVKDDNPFLKVKLLQLFRVLYSKDLLKPEKELLYAVEAMVIPSKDRIRPQIEIALAIEAAEFLLEMNKSNSRIEAFIFRLIESQNPNSRYFGLRMARRYKVHKDIAIDRCIKAGLHDKECLKTLVSFVNKNNHKAIHRRKEEMVFYMEKEGASRQVINAALVALFSKVIQYANDDFMIKIYQEIPEICLKKPFDKNIPKEHALKLFNKIYITVNSRYFPLVYQLLQSGVKNEEFYSLIFEKHLNILIIKRDKDQERDTLVRLLDCMLNFGVLEQNRSILISKYQEIVKEDHSCEILDLILNTLYLLNTKTWDQVIDISEGQFIYFSVCKEKGEIIFQLQPEMRIKRLSRGELDLEQTREDALDKMKMATYKIKEYGELKMEMLVKGQTYILDLSV